VCAEGSPLKSYESVTDAMSERRSLLPTQSLDAVSLLSSSHDNVKAPASPTWSFTASAAPGGFIIQCTPNPIPSPHPDAQMSQSITQLTF